MKPTRFLRAILAICFLICPCIGECLAQKNVGDTSLRVIRYFTNSMDQIPEDIRSIINIPEGESPLLADSFPQVCQDFSWWCRKVMKPEYVPSEEFIAAHLQLFPATEKRKQDIAYLPCRIQDQDYLVVQTGGLNGRMSILANESKLIGGKSPESSASNFVAKYYKVSQDEIPGFVVETLDSVKLIRSQTAVGHRSKLTQCVGVISDREIAFSVIKSQFSDTAPAREPASDKWFEWEMTKTLQKQFQAGER